MNKIALIIQREYITRVRNKTFMLVTLLAPLAYGLLIMIPVLTAKYANSKKVVAVVDESGKFSNLSVKDNNLVIYNPHQTMDQVKMAYKAEDSDFYILHIPQNFDMYHPTGIELLSRKNAGVFFKGTIDTVLEHQIRNMRLEAMHIPKATIDSLHTDVDVSVRKITEKGTEASSSGATTAVAYAGGFLIYMFIFLYGSMVMRGVQEEKQSRVVEIIISSVKPFQLMMGKIVGIAMVGLTQVLIWVALTLIFTTIGGSAMGGHHAAEQMAANQGGQKMEAMQNAMSAIGTLPIGLIVTMFLFYFLGGYLIYSSFFAAAASAVDSQAEMSQFILPISIPIIVSIASISTIIQNPDGPFAFWMSMIPLTSPIVMMARIPFGVPAWQLALSIAILIGSFIVSVWLAGKIYRIGILMYGKKITWKELGKWLFYK